MSSEFRVWIVGNAPPLMRELVAKAPAGAQCTVGETEAGVGKRIGEGLDVYGLSSAFETVRIDRGRANLGLSEEAGRSLSRATHLFAGLDSLSFEGEPETRAAAEARFLERMLSRAPDLSSFIYLSTAYLDDVETARNVYEAERRSGERACERSAVGRVVRTSLVVENADEHLGGGPQLRKAVELLSGGRVPVVPGRKETMLDCIPAAWAARVLWAFVEEPRIDGPFPLAAGPGGATTVEELIRMLCRRFDVKVPRIIDPTFFLRVAGPILRLALGRKVRRWINRGRPLLPYLKRSRPFDAAPLERLLRTKGWSGPSVLDYFQRIADQLERS